MCNHLVHIFFKNWPNHGSLILRFCINFKMRHLKKIGRKHTFEYLDEYATLPTLLWAIKNFNFGTANVIVRYEGQLFVKIHSNVYG